MAWASQSNGAETRVAAASPATSHTLEMTGMSQIATAHHTLPKKQLLVLGLDGLADVPEEIDQRHRCAADDCRPAGDEDADLPATSQRSEERRVGKEWRARGGQSQRKKRRGER